MSTAQEKRLQTVIGIGLFAVGVTAFLLDEHITRSWRDLTWHQMVYLGVAAIGLLFTPLDVAPVKDKVSVIRDIIALRKSRGVPVEKDPNAPPPPQ